MRNFRALAVVMGACALTLAGCGSSRSASTAETDTAMVGVNAFLWRATLDTLSFMPLESADPQGGVIITDWHANPEIPDERFKMTVYILDTRLRADGINVSVFRQIKDTNGDWIDANTARDTEVQIENAILTRARELKVGDFS